MNIKALCQSFSIAVIMLSGYSCSQSNKSSQQAAIIGVQENLIDIEIINQIINPLLDSNKFFFYPEGYVGKYASNDSIKIGLKIRPILDSIKNCLTEQVLNTEDVRVSQPFFIAKSELESRFVILSISRICFIDENRAFFYTTFYRDADFSRDDKVIIKKLNNVWGIQEIITLSVS